MARFVITGTGRCGTTYSALVFSQLGFKCGHEAFLNAWGHDYDTCPQWRKGFDGDSAAVAGAFLDRLNAVKFLQVRDKDKVVRSLMGWGMFKNMNTPFDKFVQYHIGELTGDWEQRCSQYYDRWNALARTHCDMEYNIKDLDAKLLNEMTAMIGRQVSVEQCQRVLDSIPTTINTHK